MFTGRKEIPLKAADLKSHGFRSQEWLSALLTALESGLHAEIWGVSEAPGLM